MPNFVLAVGIQKFVVEGVGKLGAKFECPDKWQAVFVICCRIVTIKQVGNGSLAIGFNAIELFDDLDPTKDCFALGGTVLRCERLGASIEPRVEPGAQFGDCFVSFHRRLQLLQQLPYQSALLAFAFCFNSQASSAQWAVKSALVPPSF